jgi:hypothetical protein
MKCLEKWRECPSRRERFDTFRGHTENEREAVNDVIDRLKLKDSAA